MSSAADRKLALDGAHPHARRLPAVRLHGVRGHVSAGKTLGKAPPPTHRLPAGDVGSGRLFGCWLGFDEPRTFIFESYRPDRYQIDPTIENIISS